MAWRPASLRALEALRGSGYQGPIGAVGRYADEIAELRALGADVALDLYRSAGTGITDVIVESFSSRWSPPPQAPA